MGWGAGCSGRVWSALFPWLPLFPVMGADVIVIRQRGPALRAEVLKGGSFGCGNKGWVFLE